MHRAEEGKKRKQPPVLFENEVEPVERRERPDGGQLPDKHVKEGADLFKKTAPGYREVIRRILLVEDLDKKAV